jgi:hypothetical protein
VKAIEENSTLYPDTSSLSLSPKSNGDRLPSKIKVIESTKNRVKVQLSKNTIQTKNKKENKMSKDIDRT